MIWCRTIQRELQESGTNARMPTSPTTGPPADTPFEFSKPCLAIILAGAPVFPFRICEQVRIHGIECPLPIIQIVQERQRMRILVTGAGGFIGSRIAQAYASDGHE